MESFMRYINRTYRSSLLCRSSSLEGEGLSGNQHSYIAQICHHPGISQEQLAKRLFVNKSSVTRQLALLEQNGFIYRKSSQTDKRVLQVFPTQKALAVFPKVHALWVEWSEYLTAGFTQEERDQLYSLMERVMERAVRRAEAQNGKLPPIAAGAPQPNGKEDCNENAL